MDEKRRLWIPKKFTFEYIYIYIKHDEEFMEGWGISRARAGRISSLNKAGNTLDRSIFMGAPRRGITRAR